MLSCVLALVVYLCYVSGLWLLALYQYTSIQRGVSVSLLYIFSEVCFAIAVITSLCGLIVWCLERRARRVRVVYV